MNLHCNGKDINTTIIWNSSFGPGDRFVVTNGFDGSLFLFAGDAYEQFMAALATISKKEADKRMLLRFFMANAADVSVDEMNRLNIPPTLLKFAHINEVAVVEGKGSFAQIWSGAKWKEGCSMKDMEIQKRMKSFRF